MAVAKSRWVACRFPLFHLLENDGAKLSENSLPGGWHDAFGRRQCGSGRSEITLRLQVGGGHEISHSVRSRLCEHHREWPHRGRPKNRLQAGPLYRLPVGERLRKSDLSEGVMGWPT